MKLSPTAIKAIKPKTRVKIALALGCTEATIIRYIARGDDNLTKAAALQVIKAETGLPDSELLIDSVLTMTPTQITA